MCTICDIRLPDMDGALEKHNFVAHIKTEKAMAEKVQCNYCPNTFARHRCVSGVNIVAIRIQDI